MNYRCTLALTCALIFSATTLHAQEHASASQTSSAALASVNLPRTLGEPPIDAPMPQLPIAVLSKPGAGSIRSAVLERLDATVHDTELARLNDIYDSH